MKSIVIVAALLIGAGSARADDGVGIGLFLGEPTGLDLKLGLGYRSNVDVVLGWYDHHTNAGYAHVTYLATLAVAHGRSVSVPVRLGIGGAVYSDGSFDNGVNLAVRAPLEIGLKFHQAPLELYGEIALLVTLIDDNNNNETIDVQGGGGLRVYF